MTTTPTIPFGRMCTTRFAQMAGLFGGGASAFSEYERGKTQPHKSTVLLLRLLDRHPELLSELVREPATA